MRRLWSDLGPIKRNRHNCEYITIWRWEICYYYFLSHKTHDIHYKNIIWHNHVRYLTVLILTPTPFLQCQHLMSSCFSASSCTTPEVCVLLADLVLHIGELAIGEEQRGPRGGRGLGHLPHQSTLSSQSSQPPKSSSSLLRHHHEQLQPGPQNERLLEPNLNCCILYFFFENLAPVVFVDPVNQDVGIHPWYIVYICFVNITINNVFASKMYKSLDLDFHLLVQGALGHTCWPCARLSPPPNPENLSSLLCFFVKILSRYCCLFWAAITLQTARLLFHLCS